MAKGRLWDREELGAEMSGHESGKALDGKASVRPLTGRHSPKHELLLLVMSVSKSKSASAILRGVGNNAFKELYEVAEKNRIAPILAHSILDVFGGRTPDNVFWAGIHERSEARMAVLLHELEHLASSLEAAGIPCIALKNAGIARGVFPCSACCPMGDLDLLVKKDQFLLAHEIVLSLGFEHATRAPEVEPADLKQGFHRGGAEYLKQVGGEEVWVELQWRPVAGRWIRSDQEPDGSELIDRSIPIPGSSVRLLDPEDNMLQVCLHTAKHSYVRAPGIRLHTDVDRLVHYAEPDWNIVVKRAVQMKVTTPVFFSLALARDLLGTPVPDHVLQHLKPPGWKIAVVMHWLRRAGLFDPDERKFSRLGLLTFHSLLYDSVAGLTASLLDVEESELKLRNLPRNLRRGARRITDLLFRYEV